MRVRADCQCGGAASVDKTAGIAADRREALRRRRRFGLLIGAFLAFVFGGWPGLAAACLFVAVVRLVDLGRARRSLS